MDLKVFLTVFTTVFLAELGDKTQIATLLFSARNPGTKLTVFLAASIALVLAAGIAVAAGSFLSGRISQKHLSWAAGAGFVVIGIWTIAKA
jgi:putative Ca2+/H+ antiporter (TMEM165/GDT1 family)